MRLLVLVTHWQKRSQEPWAWLCCSVVVMCVWLRLFGMYFYVCTYLKATVNKCNKVFFIYFISLAYPIAFIEGENPRAKSASAVGVSNIMSFDFFTRKNHGVIRSLRGLLIWRHPRPRAGGSATSPSRPPRTATPSYFQSAFKRLNGTLLNAETLTGWSFPLPLLRGRYTLNMKPLLPRPKAGRRGFIW